MRLSTRLVAAVLMAVTTAPLAAEPALPDPAAWNDMLLQAARVDGDALSALAIADTLEHLRVGPLSPDVAEAAAGIRRDALARAPTDPAMLALAFERGTPQERAAWLPVLEAAAADNGFYALWMVGSQQVKDDPAAAARWIGVAARARRFESIDLALTRGLMARYQHVDFGPDAPRDASTRRTMTFGAALSLTAAHSLMSSSTLIRTCKQATGALREDCRALGRTWRDNAQSPLDAMLADVIRRDTADSESERAAIAADQRQLRWLTTRLTDGDIEEFFASADGLRYIDTHLAKGELVALQALAESRGTPAPPADWKP